jgi:hypothetical protein
MAQLARPSPVRYTVERQSTLPLLTPVAGVSSHPK